jgi:hypothetical protein
MTDPANEVQANTPEAEQTEATPTEGKGRGPWYDSLVEAGLEGEQLEAADNLMREQQAHVTQVEQDAAKYRKPFENVDDTTFNALAELARDVEADPESTFRQITEIAKQQGLDPAAVLGYTNDTPEGESEDVEDDTDFDDPLADYPEEVRDAIEFTRQEKERREKELAEASFKSDMEKVSQLDDWYAKDSDGDTLKDANGEPISVFDEELWTIAVANYGPEVAQRVYAEKFHPLALAKYQMDNPTTDVDITDTPESLHSDEGIATPEPPKKHESIFQISERVGQNYVARRGQLRQDVAAKSKERKAARQSQR